MPVFGNRVVFTAATTTTTSSAAGAPAGGDKPPSLLPWLGISSGRTTVWRVYGSGESTYQHQLQRFVADVRAVKEAEDSGDKGWVAASCAHRTRAHLRLRRSPRYSSVALYAVHIACGRRTETG